ncbi:MAG TPA: Wzz/FepE/Etk N-terminal domain-containing protein [Gemmatimonadales bacterium]|nr:Wzz/FepE/Etk N-terminal domain-containing protein [Gemmatimonadales bacterium]
MTTVPQSSDGRRDQRTELPLVEIVNTLLRHWRVVVGVPLVAAVLTTAVVFMLRSTYTATASFVPEGRNQNRLPTGSGALISGLGINLAMEPTQSPRFYADVVRSRELLERVLTSRYAYHETRGGAADSVTLLQLLGKEGRNLADSLAVAVEKLDDRISLRVDDQTSIIRVSVELEDPQLAADVANRIVEYVNDFNMKKRQSRARQSRKFTEERVAAADSELRQAELAVKTFYERNRGWQQSPELTFEEARLRRQVDIGQQVYGNLKRDFETARIEEVNDTPLITVIDRAIPAQKRSGPKRKLLIVLATALGAMIGVLWAFGAEYVDRAKRDPDDEYQELRGLLQRVRRDLRLVFTRTRS